ncbi:hypothetical protein CALCODRAFT_494004 [Calocera cornea HHB12733]|uniref:Uncharacterized protein n=1 Tax=Calocera cornea HHB12733 TaxID=1353952 RepID=A0A165HEY4_9BASI|nr:hypothetical protein CALCODRAFT_494004 [Calocera cornea HHB12733]
MSSRQTSFGVVTLVPSSASERTRQILVMIEDYLRNADDAVCHQFRAMPEADRIRALIAINGEAAKIEGMVDSRAKGDKQAPVEKMFGVYRTFLPQWIKKGASKPAAPYQTFSRGSAMPAAQPKRRAETDMRCPRHRQRMSQPRTESSGRFDRTPSSSAPITIVHLCILSRVLDIYFGDTEQPTGGSASLDHFSRNCRTYAPSFLLFITNEMRSIIPVLCSFLCRLLSMPSLGPVHAF